MVLHTEIDAFLDNLIFNEDKIVTYKYLAINKNISFKEAKKYLNDFVTSHKNVSGSYSVVGYKAGEMIVKVVSSEDKEDVLKFFKNNDDDEEMNNCNNVGNEVKVEIYSVQSKPLQDLHLLYSLDYELCRRLDYQHRDLYFIRNDEVVLKKAVENGVKNNGEIKGENKMGVGGKGGGMKVKNEEGNESYNRLVGDKLALKSEIKLESSGNAVDDVKAGGNDDGKKKMEKKGGVVVKGGTTKGSNKLEKLFNNHKKTNTKKKEVKEEEDKKRKKNENKNKTNISEKQKNKNTKHRRKVLVESSSEEEEEEEEEEERMDCGYDDHVQLFSEDESKSPNKTISRKEEINEDKNKIVSKTVGDVGSSTDVSKTSLKSAHSSPTLPAVMKKRVMEMSTYLDEDGFMVTERVVQSIEVAERSGGSGGKDNDGGGVGEGGDGGIGEGGGGGGDKKIKGEKVVGKCDEDEDKVDKKKMDVNKKSKKEIVDKKKNNKNNKNEKSNVKQASMMSFFSKK